MGYFKRHAIQGGGHDIVLCGASPCKSKAETVGDVRYYIALVS
jgi:hypothetical protein